VSRGARQDVIGETVLNGELIPGIVRPDTAASEAAYEVATTYCTPAIVNHCLRSYVWGAWYATSKGIAFDAELLYVASMLHDIGLVPEFDSHTVPFEDAGGHVVWVFAAGAGWPVARRRRAADVVIRHMRGAELEEDAEGYLLAIATSLDISGRNPDWWPETLRRDVVAALPRLSLREEFVRCFEDQAARKPESSAAAAMANGIAARLATNVLDAGNAPRAD
jgi:hypothetical protein